MNSNNTSFASEFVDVKDKSHGGYIVEKTKRIAAALVLVAKTAGERDELSKGLRACAVRLIKNVHYGGVHIKEEVRATCEYCASLVEAACLSGSISNMNATILLFELDCLKKDVGVFRADEWVGRLEENFFSVARPTEDTSAHETGAGRWVGDIRYKGHEKDGQNGSMGRLPQVVQRSRNEQGNGRVGSKPLGASDGYVDAKKDRRAAILGILQKKDRINVKDVASVIKDCSEKTLQRELLALVAQGVLKKEGEKRWSTYALV